MGMRERGMEKREFSLPRMDNLQYEKAKGACRGEKIRDDESL